MIQSGHLMDRRTAFRRQLDRFMSSIFMYLQLYPG